jgi:hypothetical protein
MRQAKAFGIAFVLAVALAAVTGGVRTHWSPVCAAYTPEDLLYWWNHCWDPPPCPDCGIAS